jgi:hypothetical protein
MNWDSLKIHHWDRYILDFRWSSWFNPHFGPNTMFRWSDSSPDIAVKQLASQLPSSQSYS